MTTLPTPSTLKRPSDKLLQRFRPEDIGDDTVGLFLAKGFSLAVCCRECPRLIEQAPFDLAAKFGDRPELRIGAIASRLTCAGEDGCGSHDIAVFPHRYDGAWTWPAEPPAA